MSKRVKIGWAFKIVLQTCFPKRATCLQFLPPTPVVLQGTELTSEETPSWQHVVKLVAEAGGAQKFSRTFCGKAVETSWRLGVGKSYSFSLQHLSYNIQIDIISISHSFKYARGFFQIGASPTEPHMNLGLPSWPFCRDPHLETHPP